MNIFVRRQENDLFKYLSDTALAKLSQECTQSSIKPGELILPENYPAIIVVLAGKFTRYSSSGSKKGNVFPGEIDLEAGLFTQETLDYYLKANVPSEILLCPYAFIHGISEPDTQARIQAAINDSLSLKIARLTHANQDEN